MCLGKRLEVNIYMHILLFFTNPLLQPKIKRIRFDPGLGSHLHAFGPKSWPKRIGNRPFPPSSSLFLPLPPFPPFSSHWWEFFFLKILTSGKYFFLTSGMNSLSHWWEFNFIPLVRKKSFPLVRIPPYGDHGYKQGRIHGYPSRVQVGRGHIWGYFIIWAGAVRPKNAKTQKK